jgi:hypothetical protein
MHGRVDARTMRPASVCFNDEERWGSARAGVAVPRERSVRAPFEGRSQRCSRFIREGWVGRFGQSVTPGVLAFSEVGPGAREQVEPWGGQCCRTRRWRVLVTTRQTQSVPRFFPDFSPSRRLSRGSRFCQVSLLAKALWDSGNLSTGRGGASGKNRTSDQGLMSPLLYR